MADKLVASPTVRSADPLVRELSDGLSRIALNYVREGSGPGSRFEGKMLEDVQAEWIIRELTTQETSALGLPLPLMPPGMTVKPHAGDADLVCRDHGLVLTFAEHSLRTISFEARKHWRVLHHGGG
jgi:hypothetical protein